MWERESEEMKKLDFMQNLVSTQEHTPSVLKCKSFYFVLSQSSLTLTKFIENNTNI